MTAKRKTKTPGASTWKWIAAGGAALALFAAWRFLPLEDWLDALQDRIGGMGALASVLYGAVYVAGALLFVPGVVLTLGAGYLFGLAGGFAVVWIAATAAAALAFLIARYLARDRVETLARRNAKFGALDAAIGENGWKIVGLLRLSPLVPFSLSNYLYGLTSVRFAPYIAATAAGMLPGTLLYVSLGAAGKSLGENGEKSPWEWALLGAGLAATAAATVILTRVAKKELRKRRGS